MCDKCDEHRIPSPLTGKGLEQLAELRAKAMPGAWWPDLDEVGPRTKFWTGKIYHYRGNEYGTWDTCDTDTDGIDPEGFANLYALCAIMSHADELIDLARIGLGTVEQLMVREFLWFHGQRYAYCANAGGIKLIRYAKELPDGSIAYLGGPGQICAADYVRGMQLHMRLASAVHAAKMWKRIAKLQGEMLRLCRARAGIQDLAPDANQ